MIFSEINRHKEETKRDAYNLTMQDYRIMVEEMMKKPEIVSPIVEDFSGYTLEELKIIENSYRQRQKVLISQKSKASSYIVSKENPIDLEYIQIALKLAILYNYIPLEENNKKSVEVLSPLIKLECQYNMLTDEELEEQRNANFKQKNRIVSQWLLRDCWFETDEEYNNLCNFSTKLSLTEEELTNRKIKKLEKENCQTKK